MPGLSISCANELNRAEITAAYKTLSVMPGYVVREFFADRKAAIAVSGYDAYPVDHLDDHNALIVIEGVIYNKSAKQVMADLQNIANRLISGLDVQKAVADFIDSSDGDYLAVILAKKRQRLCVFNDRWGKFPVFVSSRNRGFVLSRELKYLLHTAETIRFNPIAMAEYLLFEWNLSGKYLLLDINRMPPATLYAVDRQEDGWHCQTITIHPIDVSPLDTSPERSQAIRRYTELLVASIKNRVEKSRERNWGLVVDLSGGLDSRALFAALCRVNADMTVVHDCLPDADEKATATQVAEQYARSLICFSASPPLENLDEFRRITYATDAMVNCYTATAGWYEELEHNKVIHGTYAHIMGLGGEFIRQVFQPKRFYSDVAAMFADDAMSRYGTIDEVCAILRINPGEFRKHLVDTVAALPEANPRDQLRHLYFDNYRAIDLAGEDRHRMFHWTITPFLAKDLLTLAARDIPAREIDYFIFFEFLNELDPGTLIIPRHGSAVRMNSAFDVAKCKLKRRLYEFLRDNRFTFRLLSDLRSKNRHTAQNRRECAALLEHIVQTAMGSELIGTYVHIPALRLILARSQDKMRLYQWLTLLLFMDETEKRHGGKMK
ncbi:MAG: hypothetical protein JW763_00015 [candidate division Zixibacteria bacterium]|nr:hypothetical protein [candidate division Zixibacteria bacterium]